MSTVAMHYTGRCCYLGRRCTMWSRLICRDEGVGLAAPQVGVNVRLMVYNPEGKKGEGQEWILVNPRVISSGKGQDIMEEGCLSFQDLSKDMRITGRVIVSIVSGLPQCCCLLVVRDTMHHILLVVRDTMHHIQGRMWLVWLC